MGARAWARGDSIPFHFIFLFSPSPLGESMGWRTAISLILLVALLLSCLSLSDTTTQDSKKTRSFVYSSHLPIDINGNANFTSANGVASGSGTVSDPYIIENWNISSMSENGILIENSDAFFIIRNCYIHDGGPMPSGIVLQNCINGVIVNNTCTNNLAGIFLHSSNRILLSNNTCDLNFQGGIFLILSSNNTMRNNTCNSNYWGGIYSESSRSNTVRNNNCSSNTYDGIYLSSSNETNLSGNICLNNRFGINLNLSSGDILSNNTCSKNLMGIHLISSNDMIISNNTCSNNNDGMDLWVASNNILRDNNCNSNLYGGITLRSDYFVNELLPSDNNTLISNICSNNHDGILIFLSSNNSLINNNCTFNDNDGLVIDSQNNSGVYGGNSVTRNRFFNNTYYGVEIPQGSRNRIWNNTFVGNNGATDVRNPSNVQAFDGGANNWWNSSNGYGNFWKDWTTPDNNPPSGRVDSPYNIDGLAKDKDYYPLTAPLISDPPYISAPAPSDILIPILAITITVIAAIILVSFIFLRKFKGKIVEPPTGNQ